MPDRKMMRRAALVLTALFGTTMLMDGSALARSSGGPKRPWAKYTLQDMMDPNFDKDSVNKPKAKARQKTHTVKTAPGRPALSPRLEAVRKKVIARKKVPYSDLQALADAGDSLGSYSLGKVIMARGKPELLSHALHYFAFAAMYDRDYAVSPMVQILAQKDATMDPAHLRQAEKALLRQATDGNDKALESLVRFYRLGQPFGSKPKEATELLEARAGKSDAAAAYQLAVLLLSGDGSHDAEARQEAIRYLTIAQEGGNIGIRAAAFNLIQTLSDEKPNDDQDNKV
ncbi:hypothetical protein ACU5AY_16865 [Rhizobium sp. PAMB 3174]